MTAISKAGWTALALLAAAALGVVAFSRGETVNDWGDALKVEGEERRGQTLSGQVGGVGGPMISVQSNRGNVIVRKGEGTTIPPAPPMAPPAPPKPVVRVE